MDIDESYPSQTARQLQKQGLTGADDDAESQPKENQSV